MTKNPKYLHIYPTAAMQLNRLVLDPQSFSWVEAQAWIQDLPCMVTLRLGLAECKASLFHLYKLPHSYKHHNVSLACSKTCCISRKSVGWVQCRPYVLKGITEDSRIRPRRLLIFQVWLTGELPLDPLPSLISNLTRLKPCCNVGTRKLWINPVSLLSPFLGNHLLQASSSELQWKHSRCFWNCWDGGVLKNERNNTIIAFSGLAGLFFWRPRCWHCYDFVAKAIALLFSLKLAIERWLLQLIIEGEFASVISYASKSVSFPWEIANIVGKILDICADISVLFSYVPRVVNGNADILAKRGASRSQVISDDFHQCSS